MKNLQDILKGKTHFEKTEQTLELESDIAEMLKWSDTEFKTITVNMLMDKVDSTQEQMGNVSKEMKILHRTQKKC